MISNGRLGMMLLVGTETILFSSFIGAYLVLRFAAPAWPPLGTPTLQIGLSAINTTLLTASSLLFALRKRAEEPNGRLVRFVLAVGVLFLMLQGIEFYRLYERGLTLKTGTYGALFYTLISCHGLHVMGGLGILAAVLWKLAQIPSRSPLYQSHVRDWVGHAELYWHFVTGVWLVLFVILYHH